jgi:septum formation protein
MYQFILASESPRRRQLLEKAGFVFTVHSVKVSEIPNKNLNIDEQILDIAGRKAEEAFRQLKGMSIPPFVLLAADTMVVHLDEALGKPESPDQAFHFLRRLSGTSHEVKTALCFIESLRGQKLSHIETSSVTFKNLRDDEIWTYVRSGEPMDKAGAYAIQGQGSRFVESYTGEFDNIVGLPVQKVKQLLAKAHWAIGETQS